MEDFSQEANPKVSVDSWDETQPGLAQKPESWLLKLVKEPLLHFVVLGAFIFALYSVVGNPQQTVTASPQIQVTAPVIAILKTDWQRQWGRSPSPSELQVLIDQYIHDEVFYREALALGFDQNDIIVRRRLIQKVEFLAEDVSALQEPTDDVLQAYLEDHRQRYVIPGRISFDQLYFSRELRGDLADADARKTLAQLQATPDQGIDGDRSMLPTHFTQASAQEIAGVFGQGLANQLTQLTETGWQGPFRSPYGTHLVNVTDIEPGHPARLEEVRGDVRLDWLRDQRQQQDEQFYQELRDRYTVNIDQQALQMALTETDL
jgi:hypothetical protein